MPTHAPTCTIDVIKTLIRELDKEERQDVFSGFGEYCPNCGEATHGAFCYCHEGTGTPANSP